MISMKTFAKITGSVLLKRPDPIAAKLPVHSILLLPSYELKGYPLRAGYLLFIWGNDTWVVFVN
jgi:hypothetical protein